MKRFTPFRYPIALFVRMGPQTNGLEIAPRVRFGQDHGTSDVTSSETWQHFVFDRIAGKRVRSSRQSLADRKDS